VCRRLIGLRPAALLCASGTGSVVTTLAMQWRDRRGLKELRRLALEGRP
jgi:hypothetical protein